MGKLEDFKYISGKLGKLDAFWIYYGQTGKLDDFKYISGKLGKLWYF